MASDAKACFSSKVEYCVVIRYSYLKGKTGKEILHQIMLRLKIWVGEFKRGRTSLEDEARPGRPLVATDEEMCKKVRGLVYSDRQIQVEEIAQALGISQGSVSTILHVRLGMRKLTAPCVHKSLSDEQMASRASISMQRLVEAGFRSKDDFLLHPVTGDLGSLL